MAKKVEKVMATKKTEKVERIQGNGIGFGLANGIALIAIILIFGFGGHFIGKHNANKVNGVKEQVEAVQVVAYDGVDGRNALDLLKEKAQVDSQESSLGVFVTGINGTVNSDDHFWLFYVNGEMGAVASDQYQTKNGDKIEWRYQKLE